VVRTSAAREASCRERRQPPAEPGSAGREPEAARDVRIVFDVSPLSHPLLGIGNYIHGSLAGLVEAADGKHEIVAFAPTSLKGPERIRAALAGIDVELRTWQLPFSHALRTAWSALGRPAAERVLGRFDVLHFSDWMYPPQCGGVRATTIHDLVPLHHPEWVTPRTKAMHTRKYRNTAATCDVVFVNSEFTGRDVTRTLGVPAERLLVGRPAAKEAFTPDGPAADLGAPYVLTVATLEPRKNLQALVDAHRLLGGDMLLVVAGGEGWGDQPELAGPRVRRLGFVSDAELARFYRGAAVAVYPSRFEGFGIPVLEAMASGCPIVVSSHPSLDEASGDAAVRADPEDPAAIARAIEQAVNERERLAAAGLEHARRFSWRAVGETFLRGYERAAGR
jgi:glycosyltransferase involved in cell wall biosynthesis